MDAGLAVAVVLAVAFAVTNGFLDAANSIAALVATRAATPFQAIVLASVFNLLGPLLLGAAVANTIGGIVSVTPSATDQVIGAGLAAAVMWNLVAWWRGLPSSSGQALVGGLVGAALAEGGVDAVNWGGLQDGHPVGVLGTLISLAVSPPLGALGALVVIRVLRRLARRATRRWDTPVRRGQWVTAAALAFSHGANDAQKSVGVIAALLLASGRDQHARGSDLGDPAVCGGADRGHGAGWMADHAHRGPPHLPHPAARGLGVHGRLSRGHLRGLGGRGAGVHLPGRGIVGRRRRRWPLALASRSLGDRPSDGGRVVDHAADYRGPSRGRLRVLGVADMSRRRWLLPDTRPLLAWIHRVTCSVPSEPES
jgi:phosphate/sulfate permease